jgi:hypothetical protein
MRERHNNNLQVINNVERWKVIEGYDNYSVSTYGRVRNNTTNRILKPGIDRNGYQFIGLYVNNNNNIMRIHRLVALAFIDNPLNKNCVDHINNNRKNNHINNLRFATKSENGMNTSKKKNNTSGTTGVIWYKPTQKWRAQIQINGVQKYFGYFETIEEAKEARITAVNELFKEFTHSSQKI